MKFGKGAEATRGFGYCHKAAEETALNSFCVIANITDVCVLGFEERLPNEIEETEGMCLGLEHEGSTNLYFAARNAADNRAQQTGCDKGLQVGGSNLHDVTLLPEGRWSQSRSWKVSRIQGRKTNLLSGQKQDSSFVVIQKKQKWIKRRQIAASKGI